MLLYDVDIMNTSVEVDAKTADNFLQAPVVTISEASGSPARRTILIPGTIKHVSTSFVLFNNLKLATNNKICLTLIVTITLHSTFTI